MTNPRAKFLALAALTLAMALPAAAQLGYRAQRLPGEPTTAPAAYGPYNTTVLAGGTGLVKPLVDNDSIMEATSPWTLTAWVNSTGPTDATQLIAGIGDANDDDSRFLATIGGKLALRMGYNNLLQSPAALAPNAWHWIAATCDGRTVSLYLDGQRVAQAAMLLGRTRQFLQLAPNFPNRVAPVIQLGSAQPSNYGPSEENAQEYYYGPNPLGTAATHFSGQLAAVTLTRLPLTEAEAKQAAHAALPFATLTYEEASKPWPLQTRGQAGYRAPQDPLTLPHSAAPYSKPVAEPPPPARTTLVPDDNHGWILQGGWQLAAAPDVSAAPAAIATAGFRSDHWLAATVPGTVLTTMVDRGLYPDPDYGLNNMAIPESLNRQDYWYRCEFTIPANSPGRLALRLDGINYAAEVWLNGQRLGDLRGAFLRGNFDITALARRDAPNALAIRISPPPHPGIPNEQSLRGGPGENGGSMLLDGPTFVATEGWDWLPAERDRDTGLWQNVRLTATREATLGDPQVITRLPLPNTSSATVEIKIPLTNSGTAPVHAVLTASFEGAQVTAPLTIAPGELQVVLNANQYPQLRVANPRLWWPNGYGRQELYHLKLTLATDAGLSDEKSQRFGIRELSYELSLFDKSGHLQRVVVTPAESPTPGAPLVNVTREAIREIPTGWAYSLAANAETNPAIVPSSNEAGLTQLVVRVNGVRIAARGGNWGMDNARKRVSRERLEPYFRLHQQANLNIIRNWVGQSTEQSFYDLADEYGMLVWNDFWESTQDYNAEAQDPDLFLRNAADVIQRFRNHASILLWCGRNEGVPQPILNEGLDKLIRQYDGTRYYTPSSNSIDLQPSGPYHYQDPARYFTILNRGFSVETGTASFPTLESFRSTTAVADQWPISDSWAYHDWHASGNGDTGPFMKHMERMFGASTSLEDFETKVQMLNYVDHRAIFEGFNAHLFTPNSGRMLWMTQPAWPSTMWQILSSDYDTQASFYGVRKACEPLHIQLDLATNHVELINTTNTPEPGLTVTAALYDLAGKQLATHTATASAAADSESDILDLAPGQFLSQGVIFARLDLKDATGATRSTNFYWLSDREQSLRKLNTLPPAQISLTLKQQSPATNGDNVLQATLTNKGTTVALAAKLTLEDARKERILPAYYSDNYISLLPGETREVNIAYPTHPNESKPRLSLRGWNIQPATVKPD